MSKRLSGNDLAKPAVRMKLLQISTQELKTIRVAIRRKDVPQDTVSGPLIRGLENPEDLVIHKPGEGDKPIFDRDDIVVNSDFEERVVVTTPESPKRRSRSKSAERQTTSIRDRRSRSHSEKRSPDRKYYNRSRSRSTDRGRHSSNSSKEHSRNKSKLNSYRDSSEYGNRRVKTDDYKTEASSSQKNTRRSLSKERRRSFSRDREHSSRYQKSPPRPDSYRGSHYESDRKSRRTPSPYKNDYRHRKYSRSPTYKRESTHRDHTLYRKSQERRSRSPSYRERDSKYIDYRKRSRSPYSRERYKSPRRKEHRGYSRSPPKYTGPREVQRRHNPVPYQIPPHFGSPWPVYDPMSPYVRFIIPEGYVPAPPPRFPGSMPIRPRLPPRQLPVYNNRPVPKIKDSDNNTTATNANTSTLVASSSKISESASKSENTDTSDTANTSKESGASLSVVTTTQEIVKITD